MARYALIDQAGLIKNIIEADPNVVYVPANGLTIVEDTLAQFAIGGTYILGVYTPPGPPVLTWAEVRARRDELLAASDWATMPDSSASNANRLAWVQYRQLLKNIPQTFASPDLIVWPPKPVYVKTSASAVQLYRIAATFSGFVSFAIPAKCYIDRIILFNTTGNAITGGLKFGTTLGAADVIAAVPVGPNASIVVPNAQLLKAVFSLTLPQNIGIDAVTSWNGATVIGAVVYGQL
jgi:hypothetical protein